MHDNTPFVSVIIPAYNRDALVGETLDSVLSQTYSNWECIVVDDGSTDNTWSILEDYAKKDARIKIFKRDRNPKGANTCRNIGVKNAKGEYLIFLDSDDLLASWCLEERMLFINRNNGFDFYLSQGLNFLSNGDFFLSCNPKEKDYLLAFVSFQTAFQTTPPTWNKNFLLKVGEWNEDLLRWQDPEMHIRALLKKPRFVWISEIPDYLIRYDNKDLYKITNMQNVYYSYDKILKSYYNVYLLLNKNYRLIFKKYIINQSWHFAINMNKKHISLTSKLLYEYGFMTRLETLNFFVFNNLYNIFRNIPIVRKILFLLISKNYSKLNTYLTYFDYSAINIFKKKYTKK